MTYVHLSGLFLASICLRLLYLELASNYLGLEEFAAYVSDSQRYLLAGEHILTPHRMGDYLILRFGPGYALILAAIKFLFGANLIWPILFNIAMGALAPVFVYLLAWHLLRSRAVALVASGFSVVSLTSISLSCHILTDQPFFTLHAAALVCFVRGYLTGSLRWYLLAGLLAGYAAYVRPIGQIWPIVFIFLLFVLPVSRRYRSRTDFVRRAGVTGALMLLMILGWSARNYAKHDLFVFGTHGVLTARCYWLARVAEKTWGENKQTVEYRDEWGVVDGDDSDNYEAAYGKAVARIAKEWEASPDIMLQQYFQIMHENMIAGNSFVSKQVPQLNRLMVRFNNAVKHWLGDLLIVLTLAGLALMAVRGFGSAAWILGATYVAFTVLLGTTFWQGSRLHHPAEMAWSIVVAYVIVTATKYISGILRIRSGRRQH